MTAAAAQVEAPAELLTWLAAVTGHDDSALSVTLVAGDASPRRYFRVRLDTGGKTQPSLIAVISPPTEKNEAFLAIRDLLEASAVRVPGLTHPST